MLRTGVDMIEIERVAQAVATHGERFLARVYTKDELAYCGREARLLAVRFAAKEAIAKALGTGIRPPATLSAIGVGHDPLGKPVIECYGELEKMVKIKNLKSHLSISDEADYAVAYVILEQA